MRFVYESRGDPAAGIVLRGAHAKAPECHPPPGPRGGRRGTGAVFGVDPNLPSSSTAGTVGKSCGIFEDICGYVHPRRGAANAEAPLGLALGGEVGAEQQFFPE